ncbi:AbrB/MazE/SpoVT family DNA-binding domain-containing protein [Paenibacillus zanthoxyli]|uniref:AbrB/MazE/SpoVT family DNA-binding domain-containing protein n=1 Tax=Paenibacillus zanthoxyli TaxID=369399 RepID=UPI00046EF320|nr:AbrB/MazE/SpoVT family DNA-binding domain-containing protein [Paenibacillus zanthoxyli]
MKATGIVRRIDDLGRVVVPKELRRMLNIEEGDPIEFFSDGDKVILKKYSPGCTFCGEEEHLQSLGGKPICLKCVQILASRQNELTKELGNGS